MQESLAETQRSYSAAFGRPMTRRVGEGTRPAELQRAKASWDGWHWGASRIAGLSAKVGDKEGALEWLERAYRARSGSLIWIPAHAPFHLLDDEPRYRRLMKELDLSPAIVKRDA